MRRTDNIKGQTAASAADQAGRLSGARFCKNNAKRKLRDSPRLPVAEAEHSSDLVPRCDAPASIAGLLQRQGARQDAAKDQSMLFDMRPVYFKGTHMPVDGWFQPCRLCRCWTANVAEGRTGKDVSVCRRCLRSVEATQLKVTGHELAMPATRHTMQSTSSSIPSLFLPAAPAAVPSVQQRPVSKAGSPPVDMHFGHMLHVANVCPETYRAPASLSCPLSEDASTSSSIYTDLPWERRAPPTAARAAGTAQTAGTAGTAGAWRAPAPAAGAAALSQAAAFLAPVPMAHEHSLFYTAPLGQHTAEGLAAGSDTHPTSNSSSSTTNMVLGSSMNTSSSRSNSATTGRLPRRHSDYGPARPPAFQEPAGSQQQSVLSTAMHGPGVHHLPLCTALSCILDISHGPEGQVTAVRAVRQPHQLQAVEHGAPDQQQHQLQQPPWQQQWLPQQMLAQQHNMAQGWVPQPMQKAVQQPAMFTEQQMCTTMQRSMLPPAKRRQSSRPDSPQQPLGLLK